MLLRFRKGLRVERKPQGEPQNKVRKPQGQALIIVAMMILTFISLLTFIIHTGQLINAKINLQNAADLAAYAGASVQARQLNDVSFLNYEMRRNYKKFLFRYFVVGNMAQKSSLTMGASPDANRVWSPNGDPAINYRVPAVCVVFNPEDNFCQVDKLPAIAIPTANVFDSISTALKGQLEALEKIRKANCSRIDITNKVLATLWLFNADPDLKLVDQLIQDSAGTSSDAAKLAIAFKSVKGLASGIGLIPKLLLISQRIKTLEKYINLPANNGQPSLNQEVVDGFQNAPAVARPRLERPISAYLSAFNTLGEYAFDPSTITLKELLPAKDEKTAALAEFTEIKTDFEAYYVGFPTLDENSTDANCDPAVIEIPVKGLPVGFQKSPQLLTYYAVKLEASTNLMFSPFGPLKLTAYAAAQPFGSRIGPQFAANGTDKPFVADGLKATSCGTGAGGGQCFGVPNLPVLAGESDTASGGWFKNGMLSEINKKLLKAVNNPGTASGVIGSVNAAQMESVYPSAMAPNPAEQGKYNVINDLAHNDEDPNHEKFGDPFVSYYGSQLVTQRWAPILSDDEVGSNPADAVSDVINQQTKLPAQIKDVVKRSISEYITKLVNNSGGEAGETFNLYSVQNPLTDTLNNNAVVDIGKFGMDLRTPAALKTSWSNVRHAPLADRRRTGYSVKFIPFDLLMNPGKDGVTSNGTDVWDNPITNAIEDVDKSAFQFLKH